MEPLYLQEIISRALAEDIGHGDITTSNLVEAQAESEGIFTAKAAGIVAGITVARAVFHYLDPETEFTALIEDGQAVAAGDTIARVKGKTRPVDRGAFSPEFYAAHVRNCYPYP